MAVVYASENLTKTLHRHFVSYMCFDSGSYALQNNGGNPVCYHFSGFVIEIDDDWLVVSAGHIFSNLKKAMKSGAKLSNWMIDDSAVSSNPQPANPIPLDIEKDVLFLYHEKIGMDYAVFKLPKLTCMALEAQGIVPICHELWSTDGLEQFPTWILVGVPFETVKAGFTAVEHEKYIVTMQLNRTNETPSGFEDLPFKRLYATVDFESIGDNGPKIKDIGGMSGGPIFGLQGDDKDFTYRLIGIQSGWNSKNAVSICAAQPFIDAIRETL